MVKPNIPEGRFVVVVMEVELSIWCNKFYIGKCFFSEQREHFIMSTEFKEQRARCLLARRGAR
jgi:hypothetical protein